MISLLACAVALFGIRCAYHDDSSLGAQTFGNVLGIVAFTMCGAVSVWEIVH